MRLLGMKYSIEDADNYEQYYSEKNFGKKLRQVATQVGAKLLYPALQLYYLLRSSSTPVKDKTIIIGALGYLILPVDLVPDFIPALGFTDDLTALMITLRTLGKDITPEIRRQAKEHTEKLLKQ